MEYDRFVITGCGRSGTGFYSNLMKENGINCGHESYISLRGPKSFNFVAESSWLAVPFLASIPDNYYIIRTLRDPFKVIKSFYELSVFISLGSPYYKFIKSNLLGSIVDINLCLEKKSRDSIELRNISNYYLEWNRLFDTKIGSKKHSTICFEGLLKKATIDLGGKTFKIPQKIVNDKKSIKKRNIEIDVIKNILGNKKTNELQEYYNLYKGQL